MLEAADLDNDDGECSICLDCQKVGDLAVRLPCGHFFHKRCIEPWVKRNAICPTCRAPVIRELHGKTGASPSNFVQRKKTNRNAHEEKVREMARAMREMEEEERRARERKEAEEEKAWRRDLQRDSKERPARSGNGAAAAVKECELEEAGDKSREKKAKNPGEKRSRVSKEGGDRCTDDIKRKLNVSQSEGESKPQQQPGTVAGSCDQTKVSTCYFYNPKSNGSSHKYGENADSTPTPPSPHTMEPKPSVQGGQTRETVDSYANISARELKRRLNVLGIDTGAAIERSEIAKLLEDACSGESTLKCLSVRELKRRLGVMRVDHKHVVMKSELVELLAKAVKREESSWGPKTRREWVSKTSASNCATCAKRFSLIRRKHHCRYCGSVVCDACSKERAAIDLDHFGMSTKNSSESYRRAPTSKSDAASTERSNTWRNTGINSCLHRPHTNGSDTCSRVCKTCAGKLRAHAKRENDRQRTGGMKNLFRRLWS